MFVNGLEIGSDGRVVTSSVAVAAGDPAGGGFTYDRTTGGIKAAVAVPTSYANGFGFNVGNFALGQGRLFGSATDCRLTPSGSGDGRGRGDSRVEGGLHFRQGDWRYKALGRRPLQLTNWLAIIASRSRQGTPRTLSVSPSKMPELAVMSGGCADFNGAVLRRRTECQVHWGV